MAVTELALLHLLNPLTPSLKSKLLSAKQAMESFTSHDFHFYTQLQDPSYVYIIGTWDSVEQHREVWLPSERNQEILRELEGEVCVEWMFHVDLGDGKGAVADDVAPLDAPVLGVARYFVKPGSKDGFGRELREKRGVIEGYVKPRRVAGGWRVDGKEGGEEEFVQFTGWESLEHYGGFKGVEGFGEYLKIKEWAEGCEVRHAVRLEL
ncbi:hypothetical protein FQN54_006413 [Arachnomyces sp. PD_36]|nr:hypothetical protein FQN54_006413 [Arachnomyces sp. PD_36]